MKKYFSALLLLTSMQAYCEQFTITNVGIDLSQQTLFVGITPIATSSPCGRKDELKWSLTRAGIKNLEAMARSWQKL